MKFSLVFKMLSFWFLLMNYSCVSCQSYDFIPISKGERVVHTYYILSYIDTLELAEWVAYKLEKKMLSGAAKRKDNFKADPLVKTGSALPGDYRKSGYDRGHLCPAADMTFSQNAMDETFYMSNMSPQKPGFNRGVWKICEEKVRDWVSVFEMLYIVTGPVTDTIIDSIGKNQVMVPSAFFKAVLVINSKDTLMMGFIIPNKKTNKPLQSFCVKIDSIELRTGIDLFAELPDNIEYELERKISYNLWFTQGSITDENEKKDAVRCQGITKSGTQCKRKTRDPSGYCKVHQK